MKCFLWLLGLALSMSAHANNYSIFCNQQPQLTAEQKNRLLLFSGAIKGILESSGHEAVIISRAGLDLDRFHLRYSHAGISLKESGNTPWSVRQLYYSCEADKPQLYDQGLSGFLIDQDNRQVPFISMVFLPDSEEQALARAEQDKSLVLQLLGSTYSANAYAFSTTYQNCNQWVIEVLAYAMGNLPEEGDLRARAQQWLANHHYEPTRIQVNNPFVALAGLLMPLLHSTDHPPENRSQGLYQVSMPGSVESFVHDHVPGAVRIEMCMNANQIVVHRGWDLVADDCSPAPGDTTQPLL